MAGQRDRAREAWNRALALNPNLARVHTSLGVLSLEERRPAEAIEHWKAATLLDPREYLTILGIGVSLAKAGQTAEAGAALDFFVAHAPPARFAGELERARAVLATCVALESGGRAGPRPTRVIGCDCRVDDPAADPCTGAGRARIRSPNLEPGSSPAAEGNLREGERAAGRESLSVRALRRMDDARPAPHGRGEDGRGARRIRARLARGRRSRSPHCRRWPSSTCRPIGRRTRLPSSSAWRAVTRRMSRCSGCSPRP